MVNHFEATSENGLYNAAVLDDEGDFGMGRIRIEPPITLSHEYLEEVEGDVGVEVVQLLTTQEASMFRFSVQEEPRIQMTHEQRVEATIEHIFRDLVRAATRENFLGVPKNPVEE